MANNYIEEFFISIGFDTKKVKKESKEIEAILEGMTKKKIKPLTEEAKLKKKLYLQAKKDEADNFKFFLSNEAKKKKALGQTQKGGDKFSKAQRAQRQNDGILKNQFREQKGILRQEAINLKKEAENIRKRELSQGIDRVGAQKKYEKMRNSAPYLRAEGSGTLGNVGNLMDKAVMGGQLNKLYQLEYQLKKNTVATRKLNVAQKGLVDSSRNMIRSYASVFALFQGTVAIKRVGQEFEGMRSSMLAASGSAPAAAKDMQFVNDISQEMGLNLKDTTDAFVKFKFAAKGKMDNSEIEDLFQSVSMFGTALKVAPQDMKRAQRA